MEKEIAPTGIKGFLSEFIGRVVLALFSLLVIPLLPAIINFTNDALGYDLTEVQVTEYASKASIAVGILAAVWLLNRGLFERARELVKKVDVKAEVDLDKL